MTYYDAGKQSAAQNRAEFIPDNQKRTEEAIEQALNDEKSCVLIGGSGMGKSHMLRRLYDKYWQQTNQTTDHLPYIPVQVSFSNDSRTASIDEQVHILYRHLILDLYAELVRYNEVSNHNLFRKPRIEWSNFHINRNSDPYESLSLDLRWITWVTGDKLTILLLIDRLHVSDEVRCKIMAHWLEMIRESRIYREHFRIVVADHPKHLEDQVAHIDGYSDYYNEVLLHRFSSRDIEEMLKPYIAGEQVDKNMVDLIEKYSGGLPYLMAQVIKDIRRMGLNSSLNRDDLEAVFEKMEPEWHRYRDQIFRSHKAILEHSEAQRIVSAIADHPLSYKEICDDCGRQSTNTWLKRLVACGIIQNDDNLYALNYGLSRYFYPDIDPYENVKMVPLSSGSPQSTSVRKEDVDRLRDLLHRHPAWHDKSAPARRSFLRSAGVPDQYVDDYPLDGTAADSRIVIDDLRKRRGHLRDAPNYTALGRLLASMLKDEAELEGAWFIVQCIVRYRLVDDADVLNKLHQRYGPWIQQTDLGWSPSGPEFRLDTESAGDGLEKVWTFARFNDAVAFFERGLIVAKATGRIERVNGSPLGTGFLVAPDLLLTNHHVIPAGTDLSQVRVRFGYRIDRFGLLQQGAVFDLCEVVASSPTNELDYSLVRVAGAPGNSEEIGFVRPVDQMIQVRKPLYIIQHPSGDPQKVVLQDNWTVYVSADHRRVQYLTNTRDGSSGSPVCDDNWNIVALHHSDKPQPPTPETASVKGNEGIPMRAILPEIAKYLQ